MGGDVRSMSHGNYPTPTQRGGDDDESEALEGGLRGQGALP
jgi:hypothetical protein